MVEEFSEKIFFEKKIIRENYTKHILGTRSNSNLLDLKKNVQENKNFVAIPRMQGKALSAYLKTLFYSS